MEDKDLRLVVHVSLVGAIGKYRAQAVHRLLLPRAHPVWMHLVPGRDLLDSLVSPQRIQPSRALKSAVNWRRFVISVFLRYPAEYTLNTCPIFWDHLKQMNVCLWETPGNRYHISRQVRP